jgi:ParB family transcriptional regulator, chromosome partitioning protein
MDEKLIERVPIAIIATQSQPRKSFDQSVIEGMARSIRQVGIIQPLRLRRSGAQLDLTDGELRLRAAKLAGLSEVPAIIDEGNPAAAEVLQLQLIANCQRGDLTPLEKAHGIAELMENCGCSASDAASKLGFSAATVSRLLALLTLPSAVMEKVQAGEISASAAYELSRVAHGDRQNALADELSAGRLNRDSIAGVVKRERKKLSGAQSSLGSKRAKAMLTADRSVTVSGIDLTLDRFIATVEELLSKARRERGRGTELATFLRLLRDQAEARTSTKSN